MNTDFRNYANTIADEIIALSLQLGDEIETWNDVIARVPDSTSKGVSAGYISKPTTNSHIEIVADIQAPPLEQTARLRIWAIETVTDNNGNERFNNIQLTYSLDYGTARKLVEQADGLTRDDLSALAHESANQIENVVVSDLTGKDAATGQQLGKRYDLGLDDLNAMDDNLRSQLVSAADAVLGRLKTSAQKN